MSEQLEGYQHPKKCHKADTSKCAMLLEKGEIVPFFGVLQTIEQVAALASQKAISQEEEELKVKKVEDRCEARIATLVQIHDAEVSWLKSKLPKWYEKPWVIIPLSVLATKILDDGLD